MINIDISGIDKAEILAALFNASIPLGLGYLQPYQAPMTVQEANELLSKTTYFDYVRGRVMKINLSTDELRTCAYDRDNGEGSAARVIYVLREKARQ